jgi:phosphate transport system substrate-binding protein
MKTTMNIANTLFRFTTGSILCLSFALQVQASNNSNQFSLAADKALEPLARAWINGYQNINPQVKINLVTPDNEDSQVIRLFEQNGPLPLAETGVLIFLAGRQAILPVIHAQNPHFDKELKRGLKPAKIRELFFSDESDWLPEGPIKKETGYQIYSPVPHSTVATAFSGYFNKPASDLKGIFISGNDSHLLSVVQNDQSGITYSRLSLIYDPVTREPLNGLKILPLDLNENGRLDRNELIFDNLENLNQFTTSDLSQLLPAINVNLSVQKDLLEDQAIGDFTNWVLGPGQIINVQHGYLSNGEIKPVQLTQK